MGGKAELLLHPRLLADTLPVGERPLCRLLLMDDRRFPWLVLVPRRPGAVEIHDLAPDERAVLIEEIARAGLALTRAFRPDKVNVGQLGNLVPQLHVHVVARRRGDAAWPGPVWGAGTAERYPAGEREAVIRRVLDDYRDAGL